MIGVLYQVGSEPGSRIAVPAMPSFARVERRIRLFTVSNPADKSRRMSTDEITERRDSVTASRALSKCAALKPD